MVIYKFKAKDLKTGDWVVGDLVYARQHTYSNSTNKNCTKTRPMIVKMRYRGGMVWCYSRYFIDETTIEPIVLES